jgi:hypothetical protein
MCHKIVKCRLCQDRRWVEVVTPEDSSINAYMGHSQEPVADRFAVKREKRPCPNCNPHGEVR